MIEDLGRRPSTPSPRPTAQGQPSRFSQIAYHGAIALLPIALRTKLQTLRPEDRIKLQGAGPNERPIILEKAGFTHDEIRRLQSSRPRLMVTPR